MHPDQAPRTAPSATVAGCPVSPLRGKKGKLWNAKRGSAPELRDSHRGLRCQKGRVRSDASAWALIYINTRALRRASMASSEWLPGLTAFSEGGRGPSESSGRGGESAPARLYLGGGARRDLRAAANAASSSDIPAGSDLRVEDRATAQQCAVRFAVRPGTQPSRRNRCVGARWVRKSPCRYWP